MKRCAPRSPKKLHQIQGQQTHEQFYSSIDFETIGG